VVNDCSSYHFYLNILYKNEYKEKGVI
jgi:hypothetical protein